MARLRLLLPLALGFALVRCPAASPKPTFLPGRIEGPGSEIIFCDLDGDRLQDAVLVNGFELSVFYQSKEGFPRAPQQTFRLNERLSLLFPVRFGTDAESLLVLTGDGVEELQFTNRDAAPVRQQIIRQPTVIPEHLDEPQVMQFSLAAASQGAWPLLLVPVSDGLQVWQYREAWRQVQFLPGSVEHHIWPSVTNAGYTASCALSLSLADVNSDGRDDLMVMRSLPDGNQAYSLYLQNAEGAFTSEPTLTLTNKTDWDTALYWADINRDGKLDLIKSKLADEPSFVPGIRSGKVLVAAYLADTQGRLPTQPQQVFRKSDWSAPLPVLDIDGDGFVDLVLGHIPLVNREGLRKMFTTEQVDLILKFHFYRAGSGFPKEPDCQHVATIHFDPEFFLTLEQHPYYEQFVNLTGDFNGDGKKDLVVRDRARELGVWFFVSKTKGFNAEADLRVTFPDPVEDWEVKDINGDGLSDLVVKLSGRDGFWIYTSRGK